VGVKVKVVTDSTSDVPDDQAQKCDIQVMRNFVIIDGKSLEDGVDITREAFYQRLPGMKELPTTATAPLGAYEKLYESLLSNGADHIVSIHPSADLSGVLNAANSAAISFPGRVHVIDSRNISLAMGFQAVAAAEAAARGAGIDEVRSVVMDTQLRARLVAMLDSLEYVRKGGRVSWVRASFGALLSIKAYVEVKEGKVARIGETRTRRKGIEHLRSLLKAGAPYERLALLHTNAEGEARQIWQDTGLDLPYTPLFVNVTTVIGTHVGPNCLGFAAVRA
jgi:DegV family protein with EDD domain